MRRTFTVIAFFAMVLALPPTFGSDANAQVSQEGKVFAALTAGWGDDARLTLSEIAKVVDQYSAAEGAKPPPMETYQELLTRLQNLDTRTGIAVERLKSAPKAASIGIRSAREIGRELEKLRADLEGPITDLFEADTAFEADKAATRAMIVLAQGLNRLPEL